MKVKITKKIIDNNSKEYEINDNIHFYLNRNNKTYDCFGVITDIFDNSFEIYEVQIDRMNVSDLLTIKYSEVQDGIIHSTDDGRY